MRSDRELVPDGLSHLKTPVENNRVLDRVTWRHLTPRLRALGFDFAIRATDPAIGDYLEGLLAPFARAGRPSHLYSFVHQPERPDQRYVIYRDGSYVVNTPYASTAISHLFWDINRLVVEETEDLLIFHASAAEHRGSALLFPAGMDSGKTTLVAGLIRSGLGYLTDEAVAIDPESMTVQPYPKPLTIDTGSWEVLSDLRPNLEGALQPFAKGQWYVEPDAVRRGAVARACGPRFIIAPAYERGGETRLVPLRRTDAVQILLENSFNFRRFGGARGLEIVASIVRSCECYQLTVGDLEEACRLILGLLPGHDQDAKERI